MLSLLVTPIDDYDELLRKLKSTRLFLTGGVSGRLGGARLSTLFLMPASSRERYVACSYLISVLRCSIGVHSFSCPLR